MNCRLGGNIADSEREVLRSSECAKDSTREELHAMEDLAGSKREVLRSAECSAASTREELQAMGTPRRQNAKYCDVRNARRLQHAGNYRDEGVRDFFDRWFIF